MAELSPMQADVIRWVETGHGSAVVIAVAGAGKTYTIEHALYAIPESMSVALFAFNSPIAKELNARIDKVRAKTGKQYRNAKASTFHAAGYGAVMRHLGLKHHQMQVDGRKCFKIADDLWGSRIHDCGDTVLNIYASFAVHLVELAKGHGIGALVPDTDEYWWTLIKHHDLYLEHREATEEEGIILARELLAKSNAVSKTGLIDFNDQLYLPLLWKLRLWQNDWVLVDEAQDTNPVRRALAKLALKPGGRLLAVGDPRQAIYGFTGASHDAIDIIKHEFNAIELPLTVSFRCAKNIVAAAKEYVDYIEPHEDAPDGIVETLDIKDALNVLGPHDAILCRNTAPLISTAFALIARGRGCVVLGREIGQGLISLVRKMKTSNLEVLEARLEEFRAREMAKFIAKGEEQKAAGIEDKVACITAVINHLPEDGRTVAAVISRIEGLFADSNGVLTLATIHKAKGKEWQRVAILAPELMPSKWARQDWQHQQELNVIYVARTRAMGHLIYLTGQLKEMV